MQSRFALLFQRYEAHEGDSVIKLLSNPQITYCTCIQTGSRGKNGAPVLHVCLYHALQRSYYLFFP